MKNLVETINKVYNCAITKALIFREHCIRGKLESEVACANLQCDIAFISFA